MKVRKSKITTRIYAYMSIIVFIGNILLGYVIYNKMSDIIIDKISENAKDLAVSAAESVDGKEFKEIIEKKGETECYEKVNEILSAFLNAEQLKFVYSFSKDKDNNVFFVVDTDLNESASFGEEYDSDECMEKAFEGKAIADDKVSSDEWGTYLSAFAPIYDNGSVVGIVGVDVDYSSVDKELKSIGLFILGICFVVYIMLFICLTIICRKLKVGFNGLNDKVLELSDGSGDLSKKVEIDTGDEFETISNNFNVFIQMVYKLTNEVKEASRNNTITISDINNDMMKLNANMEQCSATSDHVADNISIVVDQTRSLSDSAADVNDFVKEKSKVAKQQAEIAMDKKQQAKNKISNINGEIMNALESAKSIENVNAVVDEINSISMQTRILSLNAQVEAARAGDAGKGFAVVATEIEELSQKTENAVNKIATINNIVQQAMENLNESVELMNKFMTNDVITAYDEYSTLGTEYGVTTDTISEKMELLNTGSSVISEKISMAYDSVMEIAKAVSESANQIENVSMSSDEIYKEMTKLFENSIFK